MPWITYVEGKAYDANCEPVIVDPPSGWRHGFPAQLEQDFEKQLLAAGYKQAELDMCKKYSRYWSKK